MEETFYAVVFIIAIGFVVVTAMQINKSIAICQLVGGQVQVDCTNASSTETCISSCVLNTNEGICSTLNGQITNSCSILNDPTIGSCCKIPMSEEENQVILSFLNATNATNITGGLGGFGGFVGNGSAVHPRYYGKYAYSLGKYGKPL